VRDEKELVYPPPHDLQGADVDEGKGHERGDALYVSYKKSRDVPRW
jgi:hypothetical protein